ncbi:YlbD family protein [Cytobacillus sp. S13-E01]|uniref:YlbD family protein n=1 Tax=Cytobacillus sp. S13-E01 TaxID=3031326 RepID=UPI0023D878B3|nr:YlbD family protein [Cytobacillus sp. S13-E01]MDF0725310.1 YlbD family protein [Cytobacillus sp. S13-E01]
MGNRSLHPSIVEFKEFVKEHPKLIQEVRKGNKNWQELYEDWYLLGEKDNSWSPYKEKDNEKENSEGKSKKDFMSQIFSTIKKTDMNQFQQQISNVGNAISTIQSVIHQFQGNKAGNTNQGSSGGNQPFSFRKD